MFRLPVLALAFALGVFAFVPPALAQDSAAALIERMERLERDLQALNIKVFRGEDPPQELLDAASQGGGDFTGPVAARMGVRLSELEAQLGLLEGRLEEMDFANRQMAERLDKLVGDVDFRLSTLEQGRGVAQPLAQGLNTAANPGANSSVPSSGPVTAQSTPQASQPGVLGTIPQSDLENVTASLAAPQDPAAGQQLAPPTQQAAAPVTPQAAPAQQSTVSLPAGTPEEQYAFARRFLVQQDYASAEQALNAFLVTNPEHTLAGNARYWLGETYYVQQAYLQAAQTFMAGYQENPQGNKAPDSLLKLGMSLSNMDKKQEACASFAKLRADFPELPRHLRPVLDREREKNACQ